MRTIVRIHCATRNVAGESPSQRAILVFGVDYRENSEWKFAFIPVAGRIFKRPDWEDLLRQIIKASLNG